MNASQIAQIATSLNVSPNQIKRAEEWKNVLFVVVQGKGARFVSKKVLKMAESLTSSNGIEFTPINKAMMMVNGKKEMLSINTLVKFNVPTAEQGVLYFDLCKMAGTVTKPSNSTKNYQVSSPKKVTFNKAADTQEGYWVNNPKYGFAE
jgi:hypothetical protein